MSDQPIPKEPTLVELGSSSDRDQSRRIESTLRSLQRWWRRQTTPRIEDEVIDRSGGRSVNGLIWPVFAPLLVVPAALLFQEPGNPLALLSLLVGGIGIAYSLASVYLEHRVSNPFWVVTANGAAYSLLFSVILWVFVTVDHPREHIHWVIFFLYILLIGAHGLSNDPRQPITAAAFAIGGYVCVVILLRSHLASGDAVFAYRIADEFDWVANGAKVFLLIGIAIVAAASAQRGRELRRASLRDGLTGLLNRHAFDQCLEHLAARAEATRSPLTVAMIDIDHFKRLNDEHGHSVGDDVLRWVAGELERRFRTTDLVARYGGEEFVVPFIGTADPRIDQRLEELRRGISSCALRPRAGGGTVHTSISIGAARFPGCGATVHEVLGAADMRLYAAKRAGRDQIVVEAGH